MNSMRRRCSLMIFMVISLLVFVSFFSLAAEYPKEKAVRFIVPTAPGGALDIVVRILSNSAQPVIDQRIDSVCMPGAGGQEAIHFVMDQPRDGYTFLVADVGNLLAPSLREDMGYELSDWKPVAQITEYMPVFYVKADSPVKDANDWITKAKAEPNVFSFAHGTPLCPPHIALLMFEKEVGMNNKQIATSGGGENLTMTLGGHVDISVSLPATIGPLVTDGQLRALAVTGESRSIFLPDTPTLKELGYNTVFNSWVMVFAHKDVPEDRIAYMSKKLIDAMNTDSAKAMSKKLLIEPILHGSHESQVIYNKSIEDLKTLFTDLNLIN